MSWQAVVFALLALVVGGGIAWYERSHPSSRLIALIAALNITHDFLSAKAPKGCDIAELRRRIQSLQATIDDALAEQDKLF